MGLKSWYRKKLVDAVQFAVREEMQNYNNAHPAQESCDKELENRIVERLDKQIERWTWERFKRTEKDHWGYYQRLENEIDLIEKDISRALDKKWKIAFDKEYRSVLEEEGKNNVDNIGTRIVSNRKLIVQETENLIKKWTWERYLRIQKQEELLNYIQDGVASLNFELKKNKYSSDQKIRIVLLYQMPSMWPSWESFYFSCASDERIEIKVVFLNELIGGKSRLENAEQYLINRGIPFERFEDFDIENYHPHVMFIQTPYDNSQRIRAHWSAQFKALGIRICYIPYGLEITDMPEAHNEQYNTDCLINCWRIYTFSDAIKREYFRYSLNGGAVRALGLPKFDSLYHKENFILDENIINKVNGRKIILWKLHFPKAYKDNGKETLVTPDFSEYIEFAKKMGDFSDLFFIFMPHPLFKEKCGNEDRQKLALQLFEIVENTENVYVDTDEDYRNSLFNADAIIIDRSAVMVEAGAVGVPVLFMSNPGFLEPKPQAITPLIESYYQGYSSKDMISFIEMCRENLDPKKVERNSAFNECIPFFDGMSANRIKEDIINSLYEEIGK